MSCSDAGRAPDPPKACDAQCRDQVALRALRESLKLIYNLTLQGKPVGKQDQTIPCPKGGRARVFGEATANATQGSTFVSLTYVLEGCGYDVKNTKPEETYSLKASGAITQNGTIAVQPTATTALVIKSDAVAIEGTVYDSPPVDYREPTCKVDVTQDGNRLAGDMCGRRTGVDL
ncbi:MAG: hypothetical protein JNL38_19165 [Myxococcales bacterium]|nr:hypothetical protein [Myxococcales bacterium]